MLDTIKLIMENKNILVVVSVAILVSVLAFLTYQELKKVKASINTLECSLIEQGQATQDMASIIFKPKPMQNANAYEY